jgi:hypothetical protein
MLVKVKHFLLYNRETKWLLIEAYLLLGWARILKNFPFSKIAPSLGKQMYETSYNITDSEKKILFKVSQAVNLMSRYTIWESMCLVKAITAMKMLEKRKIESTLYLGTAKDENGKLIAHAWLRSGPYYLTGAEGMERFVVVCKFAKIYKDESS